MNVFFFTKCLLLGVVAMCYRIALLCVHYHYRVLVCVYHSYYTLQIPWYFSCPPLTLGPRILELRGGSMVNVLHCLLVLGQCNFHEVWCTKGRYWRCGCTTLTASAAHWPYLKKALETIPDGCAYSLDWRPSKPQILLETLG